MAVLKANAGWLKRLNTALSWQIVVRSSFLYDLMDLEDKY